MIRAKKEADQLAKIELLACCIEDDLDLIPEAFAATKTLERTVTDLHAFEMVMALPILKDILDRLYNESDADYLIFTNVDIALQPQFYCKVVEFIKAGHDAFMINRRRIPANYDSAEQINEMYAEKGLKHPGFDCFVFRRDLYPKFSLANVCIGVPFIEITLSQNLFCFAKNPKVFTDEHLTFHIGMEIFKKRAPKEYLDYNRTQFWQAMEEIWPMLDSSKWTFGKNFLPFRMIYWGLHPCFPIMLALKLEPRRWGIR
ncbi:MAG: hypothetical protein RL266_254 [Bacteroidota bacterium]